MRDMAHSICLIKLYQITMTKNFDFFVSDYLKGKVHPKSMVFSDVRSDKIGKNAVDRLTNTSISSYIFADFVILTLQLFRTASLHLEYIFTFSKLIPHEPQ